MQANYDSISYFSTGNVSLNDRMIKGKTPLYYGTFIFEVVSFFD